MRNIAVLLAAGRGTRSQQSMPKQLYLVAGKTLLEHVVTTFYSHQRIDEIALVIHPSMQELAQQLQQTYTKITKIIHGGDQRYESSWYAIDAYADQPEANLLLHDVARSLVDHRIIDDCLLALQQHTAVVVALPATDTLSEVDVTQGTVRAITNRTVMYHHQTPQCFRVWLIHQAYQHAQQCHTLAQFTDDCSVVHACMPHVPIFVVPGDSKNFKVTYPSDFERLQITLKNME